jgi:hypothetical protein
MIDRSNQRFTPNQLETILKHVTIRWQTEELSLLVYLLITTSLGVSDLLGWFNRDVEKRIDYVERQETINLQEFAYVPVLFPKTHQTYLTRWKRACRQWIGIGNVTFEMLKRSK